MYNKITEAVMEEILKVENLTKSFKLSRRQQKSEQTDLTVKVAVNGLSFSAYQGTVLYCPFYFN